MLLRIFFILVTLFWLTMNTLLWRAEFGSNVNTTPVPAELVWQKVLTSPDSSSLVIIHHGEKIGYCNWQTSVGEEWSRVNDENLPAGMPGKVRGYQLRLEGSTLASTTTNRIRFEGSLKLNADRAWREMQLRLGIRPMSLEIRSLMADQTVKLRATENDAHFERSFKFAELQNPRALIAEFAGPFAAGMVDQLGLPAGRPGNPAAGFGVKWEAREDTMRIGHAPIRVYRLQTRLLDRYPVTLTVSRVGELLRVELPGDLVLVNDQLTIQ